ncbi:helix-turn-helix domain-containing protein [Streptomyces longispororuber]|uniref:ArsR/SmtB family transcription factor n=1 Tax=Streptomyces longispororuber TaxID=68230 RepID=UPI0033DA90DD
MTGEPERPAQRKIHHLDARSLRGLAHPLRMRLLSSLRRDGPATASQLADRLGESSGATSYHLRQLAEYGFVEDAPERGTGRERWWRAVYDGTMLGDELRTDPDPEVRGAVGTLLYESATQHSQELSTWLGTTDDWPKEWVESSDVSDFTLRLTPELSAELGRKVHALIESYRALAPEADTPDAATVRVHLHQFPTRTAT